MIRQTKVIINNTVYGMKVRECKKLLEIAKKQVVHGIYAIEKDSVYELKNETYETDMELIEAIGNYKYQGFVVHYN